LNKKNRSRNIKNKEDQYIIYGREEKKRRKIHL
jgi:hypothetical protein